MPDIQTCVVCGAQSHRTDWIKKLLGFVGCDSHSDTEMKDAVAKASAPKVELPKSVAPAVKTAAQAGAASTQANQPAPPAPLAGDPKL